MLASWVEGNVRWRGAGCGVCWRTMALTHSSLYHVLKVQCGRRRGESHCGKIWQGNGYLIQSICLIHDVLEVPEVR
jgi:hypothetical protein